MDQFPGNSQKAKRTPPPVPQAEPRPKVEQVTTAKQDRRKRGLGSKFRDTFIQGSATMARDYVVEEVVVPTIKTMMFEVFQSALEQFFFGDTRPRRPVNSTAPNSGLGPKVNYQSITSPTRATSEPTRMLSRRSRTRFDFGDIIIPSRTEAEEVLDRLYDQLSRYDSVTVADLYALTGIATSHTDHKWGWTSLKGARATRIGNGQYLLDLPIPEPLER